MLTSTIVRSIYNFLNKAVTRNVRCTWIICLFLLVAETTNVDLETPPILEMKSQPEPVLSNTELQHFAFQIASGMAYLEKQNITHRFVSNYSNVFLKLKELFSNSFLLTKYKLLFIWEYFITCLRSYIKEKVSLHHTGNVHEPLFTPKSRLWNYYMNFSFLRRWLNLLF